MTADGAVFHLHKAKGMVLDIFRTRNMRDLLGAAGIGHTRYPTAGSAVSVHEAQPFYVNSPFGITLAHNVNLTNGDMVPSNPAVHSDSRVLSLAGRPGGVSLLSVRGPGLHPRDRPTDPRRRTPHHLRTSECNAEGVPMLYPVWLWSRE